MGTLLDNCGFNPTTGGTTNWTYSSRVAGYNNPADAGIANGSVVKYHAFSADRSQWEIGEGAYNTSTGVLARTTVMFNSARTGATGSGQSGAGTKISFSAAPTVVIVGLAEDLIGIDYANSFTSTQKAQARSNIGADFESGTLTLFYQASAPTGWTKITTQNDKALRVVSGTGGVAGGTNAFSTVMAQTVVGNTTLSTAQMPSHGHTSNHDGVVLYRVIATSTLATPGGLGCNFAGPGFAINANGGGGAHNHGITMDIQYLDLILASKN